MAGLMDYDNQANGLGGAVMDAALNKKWMEDQQAIQKGLGMPQGTIPQASMIVRLERIEDALREIARVIGIKFKF